MNADEDGDREKIEILMTSMFSYENCVMMDRLLIYVILFIGIRTCLHERGWGCI